MQTSTAYNLFIPLTSACTVQIVAAGVGEQKPRCGASTANCIYFGTGQERRDKDSQGARQKQADFIRDINVYVGEVLLVRQGIHCAALWTIELLLQSGLIRVPMSESVLLLVKLGCKYCWL